MYNSVHRMPGPSPLDDLRLQAVWQDIQQVEKLILNLLPVKSLLHVEDLNRLRVKHALFDPRPFYEDKPAPQARDGGDLF
jgi:hypothetical protein